MPDPTIIIFDDKTRVDHLFSLLATYSGKIEVSSFDDIYFKGNYILDGTNSPDDKLVIPGAVLKDFDVYIYPSGKVKLTRTYRESETYRPEFSLTISGFDEIKFSKWGLEHPGFLKDPEGKYIVTESNSRPRSLGKDMSTNSDGPRSEVIANPIIQIERSHKGNLIKSVRLLDGSGQEVCSHSALGINFAPKDSGYDYEFTIPEFYRSAVDDASKSYNGAAELVEFLYKKYSLSGDTPIVLDGRIIGFNELGLVLGSSDKYLESLRGVVEEYNLYNHAIRIQREDGLGLPKEFEEIFRKFSIEEELGSIFEKAKNFVMAQEISIADESVADKKGINTIAKKLQIT